MPYRSRIAELSRIKDVDGRTLCFTIPDHSRSRRRVDFIEKAAVPEFEGDSAWFEIVKVPAVPWPKWTVIRRVEGPR